jgi:hypothetical protein
MVSGGVGVSGAGGDSEVVELMVEVVLVVVSLWWCQC